MNQWAMAHPIRAPLHGPQEISPHHRLILLRTADRFRLHHAPAGNNGIDFRKTAQSSVPAVSFGDVLRSTGRAVERIRTTDPGLARAGLRVGTFAPRP